MSEWVSWESCPRCGGEVAVGWRTAPGESPVPGQERGEPIQFDCPDGCHLGETELAAFARR